MNIKVKNKILMSSNNYLSIEFKFDKKCGH